MMFNLVFESNPARRLYERFGLRGGRAAYRRRSAARTRSSTGAASDPVIDPRIDWPVNSRDRARGSSTAQLERNKDRNLAVAGALVRGAAADGAELIVLPEKFNVLGSPDDLRAGAEPLPGPTTDWAGALCRELGVWLVAGSIVERVEGDDKLRNTSVLSRPTARSRAVYRKIHMFDVEVGGVDVPRVGRRGARARRSWSRTSAALELGHGGLLRPALPRAVPHHGRARRARRSRCRRRSPCRPAGPTGRCCCARARSRTRPS